MSNKISTTIFALFLVLMVSGCAGKDSSNESSDGKNKNFTNNFSAESETAVSENDSKSESNDGDDWKTYVNEEMKYEIKYPSSWFFVDDACCPPPPAHIVINNYSAKQSEYASRQLEESIFGVAITCLYGGKIEQIGEIEMLLAEGKFGQTKKINDADAMCFEETSGKGSAAKSVSCYVVNGQSGCRIDYKSPCEVCEKVVSTFKFQNK